MSEELGVPVPLGFFSHAGEDAQDGEYLAEFCRRLTGRIRSRLGSRVPRLGEDEDVLFVDWAHNRVGQDYLVRHSSKLAGCGCLVAVLSPSFFREGGEAAKELLAFLDRVGDWRGKDGLTGIVPVLWSPFDEVELPEGALRTAHRTLSVATKERSAPTMSELMWDPARNADVEKALNQYADAIIAAALAGVPAGVEERIRHFLEHGSAPVVPEPPAEEWVVGPVSSEPAPDELNLLLSLGAQGNFFGYADVIEKIVDWAVHGTLPMLLLYGMGGIGKTATAVEAIKKVMVRFPGGLHIARFDVLTTNVPEDVTPESFASMLAEAVKAPEWVKKDPLANLASYLGPRPPVLLFLDNLESVANLRTNEFLGDLLRRSPAVRALATSQHATFPRDLTLPVRQRPLNIPQTEAEIDTSESFALFADWAQREDADLSDRPALLRVLRTTEGLPLAIDLLAARTATYSLQEIADGVRKAALSAFEVEGEDAVTVARHRSIEACVNWSIDRLKRKDKEAFLKLAPFEYPFVANDADLHLKISRTLLGEWTRWSLLRRTEVRGVSEFELPTIVRLVLAKRAGADLAAMRRSYYGYYVRLVREHGHAIAARSPVSFTSLLPLSR